MRDNRYPWGPEGRPESINTADFEAARSERDPRVARMRRRGGFPPVPDDAGWYGPGSPRGARGRNKDRRREFLDAYERGEGPGAEEEHFPGPRGGRSGFAELPGFGPGGPGFGPGFGPGRGRGRGRGARGGRAGRGDVRAAILLLLGEQPMHGYQIIQEIAERSQGLWRPSPGAVYPALNLLQDEGLVQLADEGGRKMASLTEAGGTYVKDHADELGDPWAEARNRGHSRHHELRTTMESFGAALHQIMRNGSEAQVSEAIDVLDRTRRDLYLILAGPEQTPSDDVAGNVNTRSDDASEADVDPGAGDSN